jgi:hypothetical protein
MTSRTLALRSCTRISFQASQRDDLLTPITRPGICPSLLAAGVYHSCIEPASKRFGQSVCGDYGGGGGGDSEDGRSVGGDGAGDGN